MEDEDDSPLRLLVPGPGALVGVGGKGDVGEKNIGVGVGEALPVLKG